METRVISIDMAPGGRKLDAAWKSDPQYVYAGRSGKGMVGTMGNPHPVGLDCYTCRKIHTRGEAVAAFDKDLDSILRRTGSSDSEYLDWMQKLKHIKGRILVCFCVKKMWVPSDGGILVCHAQVIAREADNMEWFEVKS